MQSLGEESVILCLKAAAFSGCEKEPCSENQITDQESLDFCSNCDCCTTSECAYTTYSITDI